MDPRRAYQDRNPQKTYCHRQVRYAVARGDLIRPNSCSKCGEIRSRIEAHHPDYSKPLDVVWLCKPCHALETPGVTTEQHRVRFTPDDIRVIRALHAEGMGARRIGKLFNCDPTTAARIFRRQAWKTIE